MITHILETAKQSGLFDAIHVSTEDETISRVAADLGLTPDFARPLDLADDHTPLMPVLKFVSAEYRRRGQEFDQIWLLMACSPLVEVADFVGAEQLFCQAGGQKQVLTISEFPVPVEWAFQRDNSGALVPDAPGKFAVRSQDFAAKYFDTGSFAIYPSSIVDAAHGAGSDADLVGYILPKHKAIDIDDEEDWLLAEALYRFNQGRSSTSF